MSIENKGAIATLATSPKAGNIPATLTDAEGAVLFIFLINPEKLSYQIAAKYATVDVGASTIQPVQWVSTSARQLKISDCLIDTHSLGLSYGAAMVELVKLIHPVVTDENKKGGGYVEPPDIYFSFGTRKLGALKLLSVDVTEEMWLSGEFAGGRLSLSFVEVPALKAVAIASPVPAPNTGITNTRPKSFKDIALTDRQRVSKSADIKTFLANNINKVDIFDPSKTPSSVVSQALRDKTFAVDVDIKGISTLALKAVEQSLLYEVLPDSLRTPTAYVLRRIQQLSEALGGTSDVLRTQRTTTRSNGTG